MNTLNTRVGEIPIHKESLRVSKANVTSELSPRYDNMAFMSAQD